MDGNRFDSLFRLCLEMKGHVGLSCESSKCFGNKYLSVHPRSFTEFILLQLTNNRLELGEDIHSRIFLEIK